MPPVNYPAATFKFNSFQEIKSHSSVLYNERMAILFFILDMRSIEMNTNYDISKILEVKSILLQIYKNIRILFLFNPTMRATMHLDTKDDGVYVTDVGFAIVEQLITYCEQNGYTTRRLYIIANELNKLEMIMKNVMQYFQYFIRPDFKQKPDIEIATQRYKEIADDKTVEELRELVGKKNRINWEELGTTRISLNPVVEEDIQYRDRIEREDGDEFLIENKRDKDDEDDE